MPHNFESKYKKRKSSKLVYFYELTRFREAKTLKDKAYLLILCKMSHGI